MKLRCLTYSNICTVQPHSFCWLKLGFLWPFIKLMLVPYLSSLYVFCSNFVCGLKLFQYIIEVHLMILRKIIFGKECSVNRNVHSLPNRRKNGETRDAWVHSFILCAIMTDGKISGQSSSWSLQYILKPCSIIELARSTTELVAGW